METGYKLFKKEVIDEINIDSADFSVEAELTAKILKKGIAILEMPISYSARSYAQGKKIKWIHGLLSLWTLIKYRFTPHLIKSRSLGRG